MYSSETYAHLSLFGYEILRKQIPYSVQMTFLHEGYSFDAVINN